MYFQGIFQECALLCCSLWFSIDKLLVLNVFLGYLQVVTVARVTCCDFPSMNCLASLGNMPKWLYAASASGSKVSWVRIWISISSLLQYKYRYTHCALRCWDVALQRRCAAETLRCWDFAVAPAGGASAIWSLGLSIWQTEHVAPAAS